MDLRIGLLICLLALCVSVGSDAFHAPAVAKVAQDETEPSLKALMATWQEHRSDFEACEVEFFRRSCDSTFAVETRGQGRLVWRDAEHWQMDVNPVVITQEMMEWRQLSSADAIGAHCSRYCLAIHFQCGQS